MAIADMGKTLYTFRTEKSCLLQTENFVDRAISKFEIK